MANKKFTKKVLFAIFLLLFMVSGITLATIGRTQQVEEIAETTNGSYEQTDNNSNTINSNETNEDEEDESSNSEDSKNPEVSLNLEASVDDDPINLINDDNNDSLEQQAASLDQNSTTTSHNKSDSDSSDSNDTGSSSGTDDSDDGEEATDPDPPPPPPPPPPPNTPPSSPVISSSSVSGNVVEINITASTDSDGYVASHMLYRNGIQIDSDTSSSSTITFIDNNASPGSTYTYNVRSIDDDGSYSDYSNPETVSITPSDTTPPTVPTDFSIVTPYDENSCSMTISWTPSTDDMVDQSDIWYIITSPLNETALYTWTATSPYTLYYCWNPGLVELYIQATDGTNNSAKAGPLSFTAP